MESKELIIVTVFGILLIASLAEAIWFKYQGRSYPWQESAATFQVWAVQRVINTALSGSIISFMYWLSNFRLFTIEMDSATAWLSLFIGVEFCYYWHHRISHTSRFFWATHSVHHSPEQLVLFGALRLGWTGSLTGAFMFYMPLVLLGFPPSAVFGVLVANLLYQFWLHTELIPKLGVFEWLFNTPSHHRVHHGSNPEYLDRNYGGILIIFDRLFNTFVEEKTDVKIRYGLVKPLHSNNPIKIALHEWHAIAKDLCKVRNAKEFWFTLFGAPGWQADHEISNNATIKHADSNTSKNTIERKLTMKPAAILCAALLVFVSLAQAQNAQVKPSPAQAQQMLSMLKTEMPKRFSKADVNQDGKLTKSEANGAMPRVYQFFDSIDVQKRGYVTQADITAYANAQAAALSK
jgi:sterol desaturase/sphingolipid hydroxylase (fatty acid hydroxylase superfamily)